MASESDIVRDGGARPATDNGKKIAAYSFGLNFLLTFIKYQLYLLTNSSALLAETIHSLTDVVGSLLVLGGIHLAGKKSTQFPYGLYKAENLAALFSAGFILLSGYEIGRTILHPTPTTMQHLDATLAVLLFMALPIFLFSRYERKKAQELNSPLLLADAENWLTDLAPLTIVTLGIAGARLSYTYFDRIAAIIVMILVIKAGYQIARDAVKSLLDASVDKKTIKHMTSIITGFSHVSELVSLTARNSGRYIFVTIELRLALKSLKEAHGICDQMERNIKANIPFVEKVMVHYEPEAKKSLKYAAMLTARDGSISEHFGAAPFIALWEKGTANKELQSRDIVENPFKAMEKGKGIRLAEFLVEMGIDILYTRESFAGKGPAYVFSDAEIEVRVADATTIDELIAH